PAVVAVSVAVAGHYRVADPAVEGYELYRGVDAEPDLDAAPWATAAALPIETPPLAPGHTYRFVLRRRNRWGLASANAGSTAVRVDGGGAELPAPPSAPFEVTAAALAGGVVEIRAFYDAAADGDLTADLWLVYVRTDGTDPDPGTDAPVEVAVVEADGVAKLVYETAALAAGTVVTAIVRTRRSGPPDADSTNADVVTATATVAGPPAVGTPADAFLGRSYRQQQ
ncbi:MAG TPA: hypothetical protein VF796_12605, partial [Humisphaera sp.]